MTTLPAIVFYTACLILFLCFSGWATIIWFQNQPQMKSILSDPNRHWSYKATIYYGLAFAIFLITAVFISFIVSLSFIIWKGNM